MVCAKQIDWHIFQWLQTVIYIMVMSLSCLKLTYKRWWKEGLLVRVFNVTFYNISVISWRSVLLVGEIRVPGENYRPVTSHWQTLSHNVVSSTPRHERDSNSQCLWWYALFRLPYDQEHDYYFLFVILSTYKINWQKLNEIIITVVYNSSCSLIS